VHAIRIAHIIRTVTRTLSLFFYYYNITEPFYDILPFSKTGAKCLHFHFYPTEVPTRLNFLPKKPSREDNDRGIFFFIQIVPPVIQIKI